MRIEKLLLAALFGLLLAETARSADVAPPTLHRIYDARPISESNPVLVRISEYSIEIPVSEFEAFLRIDISVGEREVVLGLPEKMKLLERLIDEHLFLWDAYQRKAEQS